MDCRRIDPRPAEPRDLNSPGAPQRLPPMSNHRARRQSAFVNDEKILDAAIFIASEVGLDRLTVGAVAKHAGLTSGAIYARFESREELLVAMWEERASASFEQLIRQVGSLRRRGAADSYRQSITNWVTDPPPDLRVGIEMSLIAHRVDELDEVVPVAIRRWFSDLGLTHSPLMPDESVDVALIAGVIGYVMLLAFPEPLVADLNQALLSMSPPAGPPPVEPVSIIVSAQELAMEPDDEIRNQLLLATQAAIASVGVHKTTLSRIGRLARIPPTALYSRYKNRDELIKDILYRAQLSNSQIRNRIDYLQFDQTMGAAMQSYLQDDAKIRRRVHSETVIAAWYDRDLARVYSVTEFNSMRVVANELSADEKMRKRILEIQKIGLMAIQGSSVLREIFPEMANFDWRPSAALLLQQAFSHP